jgi:hypothetical protein
VAEQPLDGAELTRADDDQIGALPLRDLHDGLGDLADGLDELSLDPSSRSLSAACCSSVPGLADGSPPTYTGTTLVTTRCAA